MPLTPTLPNLPPSIARHVIFILTEALPKPISDLPEERAARDADAIEAVIALQPANAIEGRLAAQAVAANSHAMESFRLASLPGTSMADAERCRKQASAMMRAEQSTLRLLRGMQAERAKQAATPAAEPPAPANADAEAEDYARHHPEQAALLRRLGRQSGASPAIITAIVAGNTATLRALDQPEEVGLAMAA